MSDKFLNSSGLATVRDWINRKLGLKQNTLISGTNIKTINNNSILGSGDLQISLNDRFTLIPCDANMIPQITAEEFDVLFDNAKPVIMYGNATMPGQNLKFCIPVTLMKASTAYRLISLNGTFFSMSGSSVTGIEDRMYRYSDTDGKWVVDTLIPKKFLFNSKQDTLVSGENIKTINSESVLGSGDIAVQDELVSGENIKTVNNNSLLGSGDIVVQDKLVSGSNIKTVNNNSLLGSGNVAVQETLVSGTNIKTINNGSVLGSGNIEVQNKLVSGTNIKTINNQSILGSGNINIGVDGTVYKANWTATSSNDNNQRMTGNITLPPGTYIFSIKIPVASQDILAFCVNPMGFEVGGYMGFGQSVLTAMYKLTQTTTCYVVTSMSAETEYTYTERAYLKAVRIA